jgi:hypothetical protein
VGWFRPPRSSSVTRPTCSFPIRTTSDRAANRPRIQGPPQSPGTDHLGAAPGCAAPVEPDGCGETNPSPNSRRHPSCPPDRQGRNAGGPLLRAACLPRASTASGPRRPTARENEPNGRGATGPAAARKRTVMRPRHNPPHEKGPGGFSEEPGAPTGSLARLCGPTPRREKRTRRRDGQAGPSSRAGARASSARKRTRAGVRGLAPGRAPDNESVDSEDCLPPPFVGEGRVGGGPASEEGLVPAASRPPPRPSPTRGGSGGFVRIVPGIAILPGLGASGTAPKGSESPDRCRENEPEHGRRPDRVGPGRPTAAQKRTRARPTAGSGPCRQGLRYGDAKAGEQARLGPGPAGEFAMHGIRRAVQPQHGDPAELGINKSRIRGCRPGRTRNARSPSRGGGRQRRPP